ncbi:DNA polymerase theta, putative [Trypanosoma brucei gambiense DAL972]|uniref:DNA-directed DNA polymerase n=1 Tax=Trypanosoma brucei gambiense (strain MHOM/CI/86/DAL972) TaxID=679716 RepID=D0A757_TRYB9|nr:DNA polymerase theta, putative [Trypanosoma brucei gambiense DAL972]CBH17508.1 DNA polymerase theta, putative [Trypanosoma brucei gambiense DAL972]|eukprot:XP_011779772.1 DNA polymerase theta, putative [Trypanosoma brucei gambiense DAL972]
MKNLSIFSARRDDSLSAFFWTDSLIKSCGNIGSSGIHASVTSKQKKSPAASTDRKRRRSTEFSTETLLIAETPVTTASKNTVLTPSASRALSPPVASGPSCAEISVRGFDDALSVSEDLFEGRLGPAVVDVELGENTSLMNDASAFSAALAEIDRGSASDVQKLNSSIKVMLLVGGEAYYVFTPRDTFSITFLAKLLASENVTKVLLNGRPLYQLLFRFLGTDRIDVRNLVDLSVWVQVIERVRGPIHAGIKCANPKEAMMKLPESVRAQIQTRVNNSMVVLRRGGSLPADGPLRQGGGGQNMLEMPPLPSIGSISDSQMEDRLCSFMALHEYYESFVKSVDDDNPKVSSVCSLPAVCHLETSVAFLCEVMTYHGMFVRKTAFELMTKDLEDQIEKISDYGKTLLDASPCSKYSGGSFSVREATAEVMVDCLRDTYGYNLSVNGSFDKQLQKFYRGAGKGNESGRKLAHVWLAIRERTDFMRTLRSNVENMNMLDRIVDVATQVASNEEDEGANDCSGSGGSSVGSTKKAACYSVHPHWAVHHTSTGRLYCSRPNLQTVPKTAQKCTYVSPLTSDYGLLFTNPEWTMRHLYGPAPGCVLLSFDFNQMELRVLAHLSGDELLIQHLSSEYDVLSAMTRHLTGLSDDEQVPPHLRETVKVVVYGLFYGMGLATMKERVKILMDSAHSVPSSQRKITADTLLRAFHQRYPAAGKFLTRARIRAFHEARCVTLTGINDLSSEKDGNRRRQHSIARILQGSSSTLFQSAMVKVHERRHDIVPNLPAAPFALVLCIHDELIYSVVEGYVDVVAREIKGIMVEQAQVFSLRVPLRVSVKVGKTFGSLEKLDVP